MKSVVVYDYIGTGEGRTMKVVFSSSHRKTDEEAIEEMKASLDPYFHVGIEVISLDDIKGNKLWMRRLELTVPTLFHYINSDRDYMISVNYHGHVNMS